MTDSFTTKYVRKPLYVDAVQVTEENFDDAVRWSFGKHETDEEGAKYIKVRVHQPKNTRQSRAYVGDWILYTEIGYKVYNDRAFQLSFDLAEPTSEDQDQIETVDDDPAAEVAPEPETPDPGRVHS